VSRHELVPNGWPCKLRDAPEGMFVTEDNPDLVCFKTEYNMEDGRVMAFNSGGEYFYGDGDDELVQPVTLRELGD